MASIEDEISAFDAMQGTLAANYMGRWIVIHDQQLAGDYESFETAADDAVRRFGKGPFLIRQVGAPPLTLPISVMHHRRSDAHR